MKVTKRWLGFFSIPILVFGILLYFGYRWGEEHAQFMTGGAPHPANCFSCHLYLDQDSRLAVSMDEQYLSPLKLKTSPDGSLLYVTAHESNEFLAVDLATGEVVARVSVGNWPHSIAITKDNTRAFVSNHWSGNISVINLKDFTVISNIETGPGPSDLVLDHSDRFLYVNNSFAGSLSIFDLENEQEIRRLPTGNFPIGIDISPDGSKVFVSHRRAIPESFRSEPVTEITVVDTKYKRVVDRKNVRSAHIIENIDITPDGELAFFTVIRPKNLVPSTQIEKGFMITEGIGIAETGENGKVAQIMLDEPNRYFADPYDVEISPDGRQAYISHAGVDYISVVDIAAAREIIRENTQEELDRLSDHLGIGSKVLLKRIPTGPNPKGLAISPDGNTLFIAERFADQVAVLNVNSFTIDRRIDLGGPDKTTMLRRGGRLFFNAGKTFQNQYSCSTCHPDGSEDGLTWDLTGTGRNLENTITLRELSHTSPFKWNGKNVSVYMQCGMRFSKFVTRTESFNPEDLNALVAFIFQKLENPPNHYQMPDGQLTEAQQRGKAIFERTTTFYGDEIPEAERCISCHPPPYFTNRLSTDVGSRFETDQDVFFDTPKLNNIVDTPPYLHDGRAKTLEEIWTVYAEENTHGRVNDLTKLELNDLIEYLKSIGPAHTHKELTVKQAKYEESH